MKKLALLAMTLVVAGATGSVCALDAASTDGAASPGIVTKIESHFRIFKLKDRIKNQRERIDQGLTNNTLSSDQAQSLRGVVNSVAGKLKSEAQAHGAKKVMSKEQYDAYNTALDANSATISEEKQDFYYYGPYSDWGADYAYYYDPFADASAPTPSLPTKEVAHPRIFGLKERIQNQRARIDQGLKDGTLTQDQAKEGRALVHSVESKMKADYAANGSKNMTRDQYNLYNSTLDTNSSILHEQKHSYYYYSPYYDQYTYWF